MSSPRIKPHQPQNQNVRQTADAAGISLPHRLDSSEGIEMEKIHHQNLDPGATQETPSPPTSSSRQAWSRDNPGFEPEEEMMESDWPPASPGRRSVSTGSSSGSSGLGSFTGGSSTRIHRGLYPTPTVDLPQERHDHRSCGKRILEKIRSGPPTS